MQFVLLFVVVMLYNYCQVLPNLICQSNKAGVQSGPFLELLQQSTLLDGKVTHHDLGKFRVQVAVFLSVAIRNSLGGTLDKIQNGML
jgi:hypothetical protein